MKSYVKGIATGLMVGAVAAITMTPLFQQGKTRSGVSRTLRHMGDIAEDIGKMFRN